MPTTTLLTKGIISKIQNNGDLNRLHIFIEKPLKVCNLHKDRQGVIYSGNGKEIVEVKIPKDTKLLLVYKKKKYVLLYDGGKRQQIMTYKTWCKKQYAPKN
jgi:hypothetical protein